MASWQHLTDTSNLHVEVNMDLVCFMRQMPAYTELHFAGGLVLPVKQSTNLIHGSSGHTHPAGGPSGAHRAGSGFGDAGLRP
jgi:hypothetical protein